MRLKALALYLEFVGPNRFRARSLVLFSLKHIFKNEAENSPYGTEQLRLAKCMFRRTIFCKFYILFTFLLVMVGSAYSFVFKNEKSIPSGLIFPCIDPESTIGFAVNGTFQCLIGVVAGLALAGFEIYLNIADCTLYTLSELTIFNMNIFGQNLRRNTGNCWAEFHNITNMLEDIKNYIDLYNKVMYWKFLCQPITVSFCVSLGILCQYMVTFAFDQRKYYFKFNEFCRITGLLVMDLLFAFIFK